MDRDEEVSATATHPATNRLSSIPDERTDEELFLATLEGDYEDEAPWAAVSELRRRNTEAVCRLAVAYCGSEVPLRRVRGLNVLAQLGAGVPERDRPFFEESVNLAITHLSDGNSAVVSSAAWALSHLGDDRAVSALIQLRNNSDPDVRWAVACGMSGSERPEAIETLKQLMQDADDDVRNWATFGLGSQCAADSLDIRLAFKQRLDDSFGEARDEALWGLARRKDREALVALLARLRSERWLTGDEMAAAETLDVDYDTPVTEMCSGIEKLLGMGCG